MQVPAAGLHREVLLRPDRIGHRRALERGADIEAPELLQRLVVIGDHPAVLQRSEDHAAGGDQRARANLDISDGLRHDLVIDGVEGGDRAVIEIAGVGALVALLGVDAAVGRLVDRGRAVLREAAFGADAVGDLLDGVVGHRLVGDAAVPGRAGALHAVAAQRTRLGDVLLNVELGIVFDRLAGFRIDALRPVQVVHVLAALDEAAVAAVERVEEAVAAEMGDDLAILAVDRDRRVGVEIVAGSRLRIVDRDGISGAPDRELRRRVVGAGLPQSAAAGLPGIGLVLPGLAAGIAGLRHHVPAPELVAGLGVERGKPAAGLGVAGAVGDQHLAFGGDRRREEFLLAAKLVRLGDLLVPDDLAGVAVDRDHASVGQVGDDEVLPQRDAARAWHVTLVTYAGIADPDELAFVGIARVDLVHRAPAVGGVHEAIVDERVDLVLRAVLADVLHAAK